MLVIGKAKLQISQFGVTALRAMTTSQTSPIVNIPGLGSVEGGVKLTPRTKKQFYQFLGVKYAESPSGERRFKVSLHLI